MTFYSDPVLAYCELPDNLTLMYLLQKLIPTSKQFILIGHQLNSGWFFPTDTAKKVTFKLFSSLESDFRKLCSFNNLIASHVSTYVHFVLYVLQVRTNLQGVSH